ncbi:MAG: hypothetical protein [Caudoviricetes sp.]|nr:MAG: hypothetical protein [Caudoviricetes sp.]
MKVGELRKQGWTAMQGDIISGNFLMRLSEVAAKAVNQGINDHCEVIELAWRSLGIPYENINMPLEFKAGGYWRPYLSLTFGEYKPAAAIDVKQVFTQAMADNGELPPVGSFVLLNMDRTGYPEDLNLDEHCVVDCWERNSELEVIAHTDILGTILPVIKFGDQVSTILLKYIKPFDTRTEKQKAVDAAIAEWPVADKATLELAYDLWAQKIEQ